MKRRTYLAKPLKTIWKRRWLILTTTMAVLAGTLWWANGLPRVYESSVVLAYTKDDASAQQQLLANTRDKLLNKQALQPLIDSDLFHQQRASGATVDQIVESIKQNTRIVEESRANGLAIRLLYRDLTPERALSIAGGLSETVETLPLTNEHGGGAFRVEQPRSSVTNTIGPRRTFLTEIGLAAGVLLGLAFAVIAEVASRFRTGKLMQNPSH